MERPQRVLEARVLRPGVDHGRQAQLLDARQTLQQRVAQQVVDEPARYLDEPNTGSLIILLPMDMCVLANLLICNVYGLHGACIPFAAVLHGLCSSAALPLQHYCVALGSTTCKRLC